MLDKRRLLIIQVIYLQRNIINNFTDFYNNNSRSRRTRKLSDEKEEVRSQVSEQSSKSRNRTRSYITKYEELFNERRIRKSRKEIQNDNASYKLEDLDSIRQPIFTPVKVKDNKIKVRQFCYQII